MAPEATIHQTLDCTGLYCPYPVIKTRQVMDTMEMGQVLELIADDPAAEEDMIRWAKRTGQELLEMRKDGGRLYFLFRKVR